MVQRERVVILRPKRKKRRLLTLAVILIAVSVFAVFAVKLNIDPIIIRLSEHEIKAMAALAANEAVLEIMNENINNYNLVNVEHDDDGNVRLLQIDALTVSMLARRITLLTQQKIQAAGEQGIGIPIGSFSGLAIFTGKGPNFNVKVYPVGVSNSNLSSTFSAAGINQTLHRINMVINTGVTVAVPGINEIVNTSTQVLLCESIIIGKVPEFYLNSSGGLLDLAA